MKPHALYSSVICLRCVSVLFVLSYVKKYDLLDVDLCIAEIIFSLIFFSYFFFTFFPVGFRNIDLFSFFFFAFFPVGFPNMINIIHGRAI